MNWYVVDVETDGLDASRIHVMSVGWVTGEDPSNPDHWSVISTDNYDTMRGFLGDPNNIIIGHNFILFDKVQLEKVLECEVEATIIDTLPLAWYIFPKRSPSKFGLESFGGDYGVEKPPVDDWENLSYKEYEFRCESDVQINIRLWLDIYNRMFDLYNDHDRVMSCINYLCFKVDCLREQERIGCRVDLDRVKENMETLNILLDEKNEILKQVMPKTVISKSKPKIFYKKDGDLSSNGLKWVVMLKELGLPEDTEHIYEDPNPKSVNQLKDWLFSLGWEPELFTDGANGKVPQVRDGNKQLCKSVLKLAEDNPEIHQLDGYTIITHRLGILKGFLETSDSEGLTICGASGFTNTLRLRHRKPVVNLPKVTGAINKAIKSGMSREDAIEQNLRDGQIIREVIVAPEGYTLCGSDVVSLEDNTKRHYMWDYDPDYVTEQMSEGFDPHLDLAVKAGAITQEQADDHKNKRANYKDVRDLYKKANYSCIYGIGAKKLSEDSGLTRGEARELIDAYWVRNWSIKQLPKDISVKKSFDHEWILNPVSGFYYNIRTQKDIFSTLNQGTGVFVFDLWIKLMREEGLHPFLQYHDEVVLYIDRPEEEVDTILKECMEEVNNILQLNIEIQIDVQFNDTYAGVH